MPRSERAIAPVVDVPLSEYAPRPSLRATSAPVHAAVDGDVPVRHATYAEWRAAVGAGEGWEPGRWELERWGAEQYAEVLSRQNWHWFLTLTFRPEHEKASGGMHPEKADKIFRVLLSKINREIYGVRWYKRPDGGVMWARGQEFHKDGRIHFHALAAAPTDDLNNLTRRMRWVDWWWREKIGIARIEEPLSQADVAGYVSKYVTKDGEVDFSPNYGRYVPPALDFGNAVQPSPTSITGAPAAVAKRTGGQDNAAPFGASRCLTLPVSLSQLPFTNETFYEPDLRT